MLSLATLLVNSPLFPLGTVMCSLQVESENQVRSLILEHTGGEA